MRNIKFNPKKTSPIKKETKAVPAGFLKVGQPVSQRAKDFMKGTTGPKKLTSPSKRQAGGVKFKK